MTYFKNCNTLAEIKAMYKTLAKQFHPDISKEDTTAIMQQINTEYAFCIAKIAKGENLTNEEINAEILNAEQYKNAINAIINLQGINIELCGGWIWVTGNTYPFRAIFKEHGFYFASKKVAWYFRSVEYSTSNRKQHSMEEIRHKYGSQQINSNSSFYKLLAS